MKNTTAYQRLVKATLLRDTCQRHLHLMQMHNNHLREMIITLKGK
jgi:hypothetical protein